MNYRDKILISAKSYDPNIPTGIGMYFERLMSVTLPLLKDDKGKVTILHSGEKNLFKYNNVNIEERKSINTLASSYKKIIWENINLPFYIFKLKPKIFYSENYSIPFVLPRNLRVIATVHDIIWHLFPQYFSVATLKLAICRLKRTISRADVIIADSNNTREDLIKYFKCPTQKIEVLYSGIDTKKYNNINQKFITEILNKYKVNAPYFLWVGAIRPTKNVEILCGAFINANIKDIKLYIIGPSNFQYRELKKKYDKENRIVFLNNVNNDELKVFYSQSIALVYPSLYEGFGIPILEAMASGTLVITSNVSSIPEVGGEYAFYVNPYEEDTIIEKIKEVISIDKNDRKNIIKEQYDYIDSKFNLDKIAKDFLKIIFK